MGGPMMQPQHEQEHQQEPPAPATPRLAGRTEWARSLDTTLRTFLRTEAGSAAVLLAGTVAALAWANLAPGSYARAFHARLTITLAGAELSQTLHDWVNSGLMTFFFFVVGLEARREFDLGELRERRRFAIPLAAGLGGMAIPVGIYLLVNAGRPSAHGWGVAMSTDTAFALGLLAIVGRHLPDRVRVFLLTVAVVDDVVALAVIVVVYSGTIAVRPLLIAAGLLALLLLAIRGGVRRGLLYAVLGTGMWLALHSSGVDPVVVGLVMGLLTSAYPPARRDLERATGLFRLFRLFREQPTPELARSATAGMAATLSANERLQLLYHPWTSFVIVPLFALVNAGVVVDSALLHRAVRSPLTLGIVLGYVVGKPVGVAGSAWVVAGLSRGRLRAPVGWAAVAGTGSLAGIGFTVSLLIAGLVPVDPDRDHVRGPHAAPITVVEYDDFECPYCGQAEPVVRELLAGFGDVRYVWRHLPLTDVHPRAELAAEAAEAAAAQGAFWPMHDLLLDHQSALRPADLIGHAAGLGLDTERFAADLRAHRGADRVRADVSSADASGVAGTPTFFINGRRHYGAYDLDALTAAVRTAKARAAVGAARPA